MRPDTYQGFQEDGVGELGFQELSPRHADLVGSAPTESGAFLLWAEKLAREDGRFELSRGRVTRDMVRTSRHHARVCTNLLVELGRLLNPGGL